MPVTWLHISDFHIRGGDPYDRDTVLDALVKSVREYAERGRAPDLIFATGDIAHSGKPAEYQIASQFFDELLQAANLDKKRLYVIPGNHDVDRDSGIGLARSLSSREEADTYFDPARPKPHLTLKLRAWLDWHNRYFDKVRVTPENSTCGPVERVEINGHRLAILPINSALFCQDDNDHDKLWIGRRPLEAALAQLETLRCELNLALVHHPLDWLNSIEGENAVAEIEARIHILLRGHLHKTRIDSLVSPEGALLRCAAGAVYQSRKWSDRALYATWEGDRVTIFPIRYEDSPRPVWTTDPSVFPREPNHERTFPIPRRTANPVAAPPPPPPPARFRSNVPSRGNLPFVGRNDLLEQINAAFANTAAEAVIVLHGHAGVGKSELAREFARLHRDRYTGGTFWLDASQDTIAIQLASIVKTILGRDFPSDLPLPEQGQRAFFSLETAPALLIYDNVVSFELLKPWLPPAGMPLHILITTLLDVDPVHWRCFEVPPFSHAQSLELVAKLTDPDFTSRFGEAIAGHAAGLPVQIVPETTTLAYARRRGHARNAGTSLAAPTGSSFQNAYQCLDPSSRLLLRSAVLLNPQRIPAAELARHLQAGVGWTDNDFERALDACMDLHLLQGAPDFAMHQLFAAFLRQAQLTTDEQASLVKIRAAQSTRFYELAQIVSANPADTQAAATLIAYPLIPDEWKSVGPQFSSWQNHTIGLALSNIGRFLEARPWFERAVAEIEKGDGEGRVDHEGLGVSLHQVGYCLLNMGQNREALPWFERAAAESEKGDKQGRIDHASLGGELLMIGFCLSSMGDYAEARQWFERAVTERKQGDAFGRTDHTSVGSSLHEVGYCLSSMGRHAEARPWLERAVAEKEQGDMHGRIDHDELGRSLHLIGHCLSSTGQFTEARPWYERAMAEKEQGDVHGRIDHGNLGLSLHQVGICLGDTGQYAEALPWFERAVAEHEKGDVHGRIDHESLALSLQSVAFCLRKLGQEDLAQQWEKRAADCQQKSHPASAGT